ncbi:hypothetical protein BS78_07G083500 [Paspalum vaginatum]|nr:hypothetical protein BS78_07G083500 [Paspalum vaginatum]
MRNSILPIPVGDNLTSSSVSTSHKSATYQYMGNRRMGMEQNLGNAAATSTTFLHHLNDLWKSSRGVVVWIEALTFLVISFFFLAGFGYFRRRSGHWFIQKGFLAANVLFLSLGTYSIGLMQSSSVKSGVYPIWAVSMFTLFGSIDSITAYGIEYKSQLWKMLYQICLYCGYVLMISVSTITSDVGYIAISMMSAITFIKGFHRSLALVLPSMQRDMISMIAQLMAADVLGDSRVTDDPNQQNNLEALIEYHYVVHWPLDKSKAKFIPADDIITIDKIMQCNELQFLSDVCLSFSLSHLLQRRFYRLYCVESNNLVARKFILERLLLRRDGTADYKRAFKVIEVELAFLYDTFFTSNAFLHYYESKGATIWGLASTIGICFVGVAAVIPGMRSTHAHSPDGTIVMATTTIDLIFTIVVLVSLAFLQVLQLIRIWSSNWARVAFTCDYIRSGRQLGCWVRLRRWVLQRINCDNSHLWKNNLGQYSLIESISTRESKTFSMLGCGLHQICSQLHRILGLQYIEQAFQETWGIKTGGVVELHADVKMAIVDFLIRNNCELRNWPSLLDTNGWYPTRSFLFLPDHVVTIMMWHVATCFCELVMHKEGFSVQDEGAEEIVNKNRGVATTLSKYCAYLMVSAPRLLHRNDLGTKSVYSEVAQAARISLQGVNDKLELMRRLQEKDDDEDGTRILREGVEFGKRLETMPNRWEVLADLWVGALLYAAPSDNVEDHIECLGQGGEFITHLWALLSHAGILKWKGGSTYYDESPDLGSSSDDDESEDDELDESTTDDVTTDD